MRQEGDRSAEQELSQKLLQENNRTGCFVAGPAQDVTECVHARRCARIIMAPRKGPGHKSHATFAPMVGQAQIER
jgi:hypothetical protein